MASPNDSHPFNSNVLSYQLGERHCIKSPLTLKSTWIFYASESSVEFILAETMSDSDLIAIWTRTVVEETVVLVAPSQLLIGGAICDVCKNSITGVRYKCNNCADYDMVRTSRAESPNFSPSWSSNSAPPVIGIAACGITAGTLSS
jgi:hypothetical protein